MCLTATSLILLSGCNPDLKLETINCQGEQILGVGELNGTIQAIGSKHIFLLSGTMKGVVLGDKVVDLPAGTAIDEFTVKLSRFSIKQFVDLNHKEFPILDSEAVTREAAKQGNIDVPSS